MNKNGMVAFRVTIIVTAEPPTDQQTNHLEVDYEIVA